MTEPTPAAPLSHIAEKFAQCQKASNAAKHQLHELRGLIGQCKPHIGRLRIGLRTGEHIYVTIQDVAASPGGTNVSFTLDELAEIYNYVHENFGEAFGRLCTQEKRTL